ncbi:hypothetical protein AAG570_012209 [Ranatra chinensis]|uniref:Selenocysteine-specific elongation factor n=1 Tax=Ranatra chinensis TaxID=642074 RepID=A0ABD0YI53_9HEMI
METLNLNVGLLGHVDSGKTSIAKCLSTTSSTACFDKNPQSQERGITIDLGFSSLSTDLPERLIQAKSKWTKLQFTLVDCPGHASLIRTIIGGAQIIDMMMLVIDINKGVQTQTAECIVIGEITSKPLIIVLNKIDLIDEGKQAVVIAKVKKKLQLTLANTCFKNAPIVAIAANPGGQEENIRQAKEVLKETSFIPERHPDKPMVFSVDHCFSIKGKGTILTGTILQGTIKVNDNIELPALQLIKKVKSIQIFHQNIDEAVQGDRIGLCVTQFDPKSMERGVACVPGYLSRLYAAVISVAKVKYYKQQLTSKTKYHITVGYNTVLSKTTFFTSSQIDKNTGFNIISEYKHAEMLDDSNIDGVEQCYALVEFEKSVISCENGLIIGSKLDMDIHSSTCRIAFYGSIIWGIADKNYVANILPTIKIFKSKEKVGVIHRMVNNYEVIGQALFKKETKMQVFQNLRVSLSTGEMGVIESSFGQGGKVKIRFPDGLKLETITQLSKKGNKNNEDINEKGKEPIKVILRFKKFIFDKKKLIVQN